MRVVGDLWMKPADTAGAYEWAYGMYVADEESRAASVFLEPTSDNGPWMWLKRGSAQHNAVDITMAPIYSEIDIKARRKLNPQSVLMLMFESDGMAGALGITMIGRVLLALP